MLSILRSLLAVGLSPFIFCFWLFLADGTGLFDTLPSSRILFGADAWPTSKAKHIACSIHKPKTATTAKTHNNTIALSLCIRENPLYYSADSNSHTANSMCKQNISRLYKTHHTTQSIRLLHFPAENNVQTKQVGILAPLYSCSAVRSEFDLIMSNAHHSSRETLHKTNSRRNPVFTHPITPLDPPSFRAWARRRGRASRPPGRARPCWGGRPGG